MKIYLAHNYAARDFLRNEIKPYLELEFSHVITSRWLTDNHSDRSFEKQKQFAEIDLYDIFVADAIVLFVDQYGDRPGTGKYIEFGAAHCMNKKLYVIGSRCEDSVFFFLKDVKRFQTFAEFCKYLKDEQTA